MSDSAASFRPPQPPVPGEAPRPETDGGFVPDGGTAHEERPDPDTGDADGATDGSYGTGPDVPRTVYRAKGGKRSLAGPRDDERLAMTIQAELQSEAADLAAGLFPGGPPGSVKLAGPAALSFWRRNWNNPETGPAWRKLMLDRMAPKLPPGPDGKPAGRVKTGLDNFMEMYRLAVLSAQVPDTVWTNKAGVSVVNEQDAGGPVDPLDEAPVSALPEGADVPTAPDVPTALATDPALAAGAPTTPSPAMPYDVLPQATAEASDVLTQMDGATPDALRPMG